MQHQDSSSQANAVPVLVRRTELAGTIAQQRAEVAAATARLLSRICSRATEAMPSTTAAEAEIDRVRRESRGTLEFAHDTVRSTMITRYRLAGDWLRYKPGENQVIASDPAAWLEDAEAALGTIYGARFQLTKQARAQQRDKLMTLTRALLGSFPSAYRGVDAEAEQAVAELYKDAFERFEASVEQPVTQAVSLFEAVELPDLPDPKPETLPAWQAVAPDRIEPSVARLLCPLGTLRAVQAQIDSELTVPTPPGGRHGKPHMFALGNATAPIPVLLDLDRHGGIVTDDPSIVENVTLDLLATLPAGRVVVDVVDPTKMGASLNFLYGLGEAGERVYGQKVWGPHNIGELLTELESHVAFVTQKYLQGTYETLTEYNRAAGEVAEPYRLLLLFDHPQAFTRDGRSYDDESFARLERLAAVGRRAGVLILATTTERTPRALSTLATAFTQDEDTALVSLLELPLSVPNDRYVAANRLHWRLEPYPRPNEATRTAVLAHVERTLGRAADTRVEPQRVAELARQAAQRGAAKGHAPDSPVADPADSTSWWQGTVDKRIEAQFGRTGASGVAALRLDSGNSPSALIGGRTGSGKSVLLHSIILGYAIRYSPLDLQFYLIDFKEGVEFKPYARNALPHARVVAVETNRDFGISVLESLDREITKRGELFKGELEGDSDIGNYRATTGRRLPRIVLIIDEFHMLLEQDDAIATRGAELLDRIIRQGRAFGVHVILASQSVSGGGQKIRVAINQIPARLVLASSRQDSELLLAEGNSDAQLLSKPGEGILNTDSGRQEGNNRFQCSFWSAESRVELIEELRKMADSHGFYDKPTVFEGDAAVAPTDSPIELFTSSQPHGVLQLPIGAPMSLAPPLAIRLERQPGNNLLIVAQSAVGVLAIHMASLLATGVRVDYIDFATLDSSHEPVFECLRAAGANAHHRRKLGDILDALRADITERTQLDDYAATARVFVLLGAHRARELSSEDYDPESEGGRLAAVLRDGPEVGVHIIAWGDRYASLERRFDRNNFRQFGHKVLGPCSEDDSRTLIDSEVAASLTPNQVAVDDYDNARTTIVRRFGEPVENWVKSVTDSERSRDV